MIRLDKYLAEMGLGTRQEVKKLIRNGRVTIGGETAKKPEQKVEETSSDVCVDGRSVSYVSFEYYMLNKPAGVVSATEDNHDTTVIELIEDRKRNDLFPVGRLDKDTEGLLLITNDGAMAHRLLSPKKHVDKCYYAKVDGKVTDADVKAFAEGIDIGTEEEPEMTMPGRLEILSSGPVSEIHLTIQEGKYHQVKRMFDAVGKEVTYLRRIRFGSLILDEELPLGGYRPLTKEELETL